MVFWGDKFYHGTYGKYTAAKYHDIVSR